jgi:hypothetical protein
LITTRKFQVCCALVSRADGKNSISGFVIAGVGRDRKKGDHLPVQFSKGTLGNGSFSDILPLKGLEEIIQLIMNGAFDEIDKEEDSGRER